MSNTFSNRQSGNAIVVLLAGIIVVVVVATGVMVAMRSKKDQPVAQGSSDSAKQAADDKAAANSDSSSSGSGNSSTETPGRAARNTNRADDANSLLAASAEYQANNNGQLPTGYENGQLVGGEGSTPSPVDLKFFIDVTLASGAHPAVTKNDLILVTGAKCGTDGAAAAGTSRSVAALYGYENGDADFSGRCVNT